MILISIAIALGVVFLLVLIGLLIALARRSDEPSYPPSQPRLRDADDLHVKHHPTALLEAVGAATVSPPQFPFVGLVLMLLCRR